jgi:hypothetical protein
MTVLSKSEAQLDRFLYALIAEFRKNSDNNDALKIIAAGIEF